MDRIDRAQSEAIRYVQACRCNGIYFEEAVQLLRREWASELRDEASLIETTR